MRRLLIGLLLVLGFSFSGATLALADSGEVPLEQQPPLPVGTVITTQNWQQYKDYMPVWMQVLFSGEYAFKLAPDQQVVVGPPTTRPFPTEYLKNTEKYSGQVGLKVLPDGGTVIQNYTAGLPFPHPTNPNIADKIIWDLWYHYFPRVELNSPIYFLLVDKYHQVFTQDVLADYADLTPEAKDIDLALYTEVVEPEQSKYTVSLVIFFNDPMRIQENWAFVPSLRRPLRLSASARCAPILGSDGVTDDQRSGFNLLVSETTGTLVAHKMKLSMISLQPAYPTPIDFTDTKTFHAWGLDKGTSWPPAPSKWELVETWVVEARRVPDKVVGYCYSNRRMYLDAQHYKMSGEELYDMNGKLWKLFIPFGRLHPDGYGTMFDTGNGDIVNSILDLQNVHQTLSDQTTPYYSNTQVPPAYWSVERYGSPSGLLEIMK
jgi:Protein of unknown function (DUF1329)